MNCKGLNISKRENKNIMIKRFKKGRLNILEIGIL
jgi:hypothetical protein